MKFDNRVWGMEFYGGGVTLQFTPKINFLSRAHVREAYDRGLSVRGCVRAVVMLVLI